MGKKRTFEVGDSVSVALNSSANRVHGVVAEVREDGKLRITLDGGTSREVVRAPSFVRRERGSG